MAPTVVKYGTKETIQFSSKVTHTHTRTHRRLSYCHLNVATIISHFYIFVFQREIYDQSKLLYG